MNAIPHYFSKRRGLMFPRALFGLGAARQFEASPFCWSEVARTLGSDSTRALLRQATELGRSAACHEPSQPAGARH